MSDDYTVQATSRSKFGKGASRRLRRENLVPAILYGAEIEPQAIALKQNEVAKHLENESFYSQLLMVSVDGGAPVRSLLRDVQRHPAKQNALHLDFQAVVAGAELHVNISLHFTGEDVCYGVKSEGGMISHNETEVSIACLPRNIPEFIEVDMTELHIGDAIHLSDLILPAETRLVELKEKGDDSDRPLASVVASRVEVESEDDDATDDVDTDGATEAEDSKSAEGSSE